ncbi:MAG: hypothetical protein ACXVB1_08985 [Pseudobdellovibrionaceae bacterium]
MKKVEKNWKNIGYAHGALKSLESNRELSFGAWIDVNDKDVKIGLIIYLGKIYVSVWWRK